jgi:hypothetical protein
MKYRSGEVIMKGDRVRFHGNPATIEFVADDPIDPDPAIAWDVRDSGGGIMVLDPSVSGRTFIARKALAEYEDLEFISRG